MDVFRLSLPAQWGRQLAKHWIVFLLAAGGFLFLLVVYNFAQSIGQPFGGFYANRNHNGNFWQVDAPTPPWWPGLTRAGLRYDDILVSIEGQPFNADFYNHYAKAHRQGRVTVQLDIVRHGVPMRIESPVYIFTLGNFFELKFPDILISLGFWLLAVAVYRARPSEPVNRVFAVSCALSANSLLLALPGLFIEADALSRILQLAWCLSASLAGVLFIHLFSIFPDFSRRKSYDWLRWLYLVAGIFSTLYVLSLLLIWSNLALQQAGLINAGSNIATMGLFGVSAVFYLTRLLWLIFQPSISRRVRRQVEILLVGLALSLPYVLIIVIRAIWHSTLNYFWNELDLRYLVLAMPLSLAYVILRYQAFQRNPPALFSSFILASSAILASLGAWVVRMTEPQLVAVLSLPPFVPLFFVALLSSIFWSLQSTWRGAFNRLFQWEGRSYQAVRRFGQQVVRETDIAVLPGTIVRALVTNLELERAALWLWDESGARYALTAIAGKWPEPPLEYLSPPAAPLESMSIRISQDDENTPAWLEPFQQGGAVEVATQLALSGRPIGLLMVGKRWDEEILDERDLQIVELIAQESALFLLTALDIEQLRQVPQQIATAQERERFKIAQELHDTVQQFLGRLPFFLDVARSSARQNPAETEALLARCMADVEHAAETVRQIRNNLAPLQLEQSFSQPLLMLIEHFRARYPLQLEVELAPGVDSDLSPEARHALYRVVQQALDNAVEHAAASQIRVAITYRDGLIHFAIADNGHGFTGEQRGQAEAQGSFGLKSMEARITSLGGEFSIASAPQAGTKVSGWLPVQKSGG